MHVYPSLALSAVVLPSKEATVEQVLAWASHHAQSRKEQPLIDAAQAARAMGGKFLLDGDRLYHLSPADLKEMLPGDILAAWVALWGDWRDAIDGTPASQHPARPLPSHGACAAVVVVGFGCCCSVTSVALCPANQWPHLLPAFAPWLLD